MGELISKLHSIAVMNWLKCAKGPERGAQADAYLHRHTQVYIRDLWAELSPRRHTRRRSINEL